MTVRGLPGESSWRELCLCDPETAVQHGERVDVVLEVGTGTRFRHNLTPPRLVMRAVAGSADLQGVNGGDASRWAR